MPPAAALRCRESHTPDRLRAWQPPAGLRKLLIQQFTSSSTAGDGRRHADGDGTDGQRRTLRMAQAPEARPGRGRRSPNGRSALTPAAPSQIQESSTDRTDCGYDRHRSPLLRRGGDRRGRLRAAGGDRGASARQEDRDHLQVAVRQGAHGDGRRRLRRRDGQRQPERQLAGPLPRHDARRQVPEQPADGRTAREGGPGPGLGAGGMGRAVRPHARTAKSASATSADTSTRGSPTSATGPAWR